MQGHRAISALDLSGLLNSPENNTSLPRTSFAGSRTRPPSPSPSSSSGITAQSPLTISSLLSPSNTYYPSTPSSCVPSSSIPSSSATSSSLASSSTRASSSLSSSMAAVVTQSPAPKAVMEDSQQSADRAELPRPYKCPMCPKAFHRLEHQTRHIRTHTGEKPHACQFPGCTKRFSRSDELTRHSRIHNNPNSRRNNKAHHAFAQQGPGPTPGYPQDASGMMPPPPQMTRSAPHSQLNSPNVSPPHPYAYPQQAYIGAPSGGSPTGMPSANPMGIGLLAHAADQLEGGAAQLQAPSRRPMQYPFSSRGSGNSLSQYAFSHSTNSTAANSPLHSRTHSPTRQFETPLSTAPSSPTFSHHSISPTPDHTPLATPAHSPRLRPYPMPAHLTNTGGSSSSLSSFADQHHHHSSSGVSLPSLRQLSLSQGLAPSPPSGPSTSGVQTPASYGNNGPMLAPMEPAVSSTGVYLSPAGSANNTPYGSYGHESHLADIMSRTRGEERKLPPLRLASGGGSQFPVTNPDAMDI